MTASLTPPLTAAQMEALAEPADLEALIAKANEPNLITGGFHRDIIVSRSKLLYLCEEIKRLRASSVSPASDGARFPDLQQLSELVDPGAWSANWDNTRAGLERLHSRRQAANRVAERIHAALAKGAE